MRVIVTIGKLFVEVALVLAEAGFWCVRGVIHLVQVMVDFVAARLASRGGTLHCPNGHDVPLDGEVYECQACRFCYRGSSILRCGNPECAAVTPYVNCPTCGLSVRNPYRWGRP